MSLAYGSTYRAWCWDRPGEPLELRLQNKTLRAPTAGAALIANRAIGLNPVDWKVIESGHPQWQHGHVPGVDGVGTIVAVGDAVRLPLGLRVAYHQGLAQDGSFAQYAYLDAESLLQVPQEVSDESAACLPCPGLTAWQAIQKVPDAGNRDVLVTGAGGAVGGMLVQLAVARGWRVWATASPGRHAWLRTLGVSGAFDYHEAGWMLALSQALGSRRLFAAFDTVSGSHAASLAALLGYNGHLVCIQDRLEHPPLPAFSSAVSLHEVALNSAHAHAVAQDWQEWRAGGHILFEELRLGRLRLSAEHVVPFSELPTALAGIKRGDIQGKVVVQCS